MKYVLYGQKPAINEIEKIERLGNNPKYSKHSIFIGLFFLLEKILQHRCLHEWIPDSPLYSWNKSNLWGNHGY